MLNVSVVIPCFNSENTLRRCLASVAWQTESPREIIVIDDGSDIPIASMISQLEVDITIPIRLISQSNAGAPAARNAGVKASKSRYVAFLDADDIWCPDKLKIQYDVMTAEKLSLCGHGYAFHPKDLEESNASANSKPIRVKKISKWHFAFGNPFFTPTVMVLKNDFAGFDERFRRVDDYKAWLENFQSGKYATINRVLASGFKPPIGHSGLTGSIDLMHDSYLNVLLSLLKDGKIDSKFYVVARIIEAIKLPVRRYRSVHY